MLLIDLDPLCCRIHRLDGGVVAEVPPAILRLRPPVLGRAAARQRFVRSPALVSSLLEVEDAGPWTSAEAAWANRFFEQVPAGTEVCAMQADVHQGEVLREVKARMDRSRRRWIGHVRPGEFWCLIREAPRGRHLVLGAGHAYGWAEIVDVADGGMHTVRGLRVQHLGRRHWDDALLQHLRQACAKKFRVDPLATPEDAAKLLDALDGAGESPDGALTLVCEGRDLRIEATELRALLLPLWRAAATEIEAICGEMEGIGSVLVAPSIQLLRGSTAIETWSAAWPPTRVCSYAQMVGLPPARLQSIVHKEIPAAASTQVPRRAATRVLVFGGLVCAGVLAAGLWALASDRGAQRFTTSSPSVKVRLPGLYVRQTVAVGRPLAVTDLEVVPASDGGVPEDRPTQIWHVEGGVVTRPLDLDRPLAWDDLAAPAAPKTVSTPSNNSGPESPREGNGK